MILIYLERFCTVEDLTLYAALGGVVSSVVPTILGGLYTFAIELRALFDHLIKSISNRRLFKSLYNYYTGGSLLFCALFTSLSAMLAVRTLAMFIRDWLSRRRRQEREQVWMVVDATDLEIR